MRKLSALIVALVGVFVVSSVPASASTVSDATGTAATSAFTPLSGLGMATISPARRVYELRGGTPAYHDFTDCYKYNYGAPAIAAAMEALRTGNVQTGASGYLGGEDSDLYAWLFWLHFRLAHGTDAGQNTMTEATLTCQNVAASGSAIMGISTWTSAPSVSFPLLPSGSRTLYNADNGTGVVHTNYYDATPGEGAIAAGLEVLRTGNFTGSMNGYLGAEDSEVVSILIGLHDRLSGVPTARGNILQGELVG